jgi:hypothetical protein
MAQPQTLDAAAEADLASLRRLFNVPCLEAVEARQRLPASAPTRELYADLHAKISRAYDPRILTALRLPEAVVHDGDGVGAAANAVFSYQRVGQAAFDVALPLDAGGMLRLMAASQKHLELREDPNVRDVRAVVELMDWPRLALALFHPERSSGEALGFRHLHVLLTEDECDGALVRESVESHLAFVRSLRRAQYGYKLPYFVQEGILKEALEDSRFVNSKGFLDVVDEIGDELQSVRRNLRHRLAEWEIRRGGARRSIEKMRLW